jgi:hypothetical protein
MPMLFVPFYKSFSEVRNFSWCFHLLLVFPISHFPHEAYACYIENPAVLQLLTCRLLFIYFYVVSYARGL